MPIRLLHSRDFTFHEFPSRKTPYVPKYAILSHTWGDDEVSFRTFQEYVHNGKIIAGISAGDGLGKIVNCCRQAAADGYEYTWVDTCCIDKTDSSELSEAINSMFRWYQESDLCYAYLADVPASYNCAAAESAFRKSLWFTRGWTLQELLAPSSVVFYSQDWTRLDTKANLSRTIREITGIDEDALKRGTYDWANVAVKMSWAGRRQTTKTEDLAYSLMGLFGVNMPLIYGEGEKAFQRLQLEIIKETNDQTIFSWTGDGQPSGMLAHSPADFLPAEDSSRILGNLQNPAFSLTNRGLRIELPLAETPIRNVYVAVLNCFPAGSVPLNRRSLAVFLYRRFEGQNDFVRIYNDQLVGYPVVLPDSQEGRLKRLVTTDVYIRGVKLGLFHMHRWTTFRLKTDSSRSVGGSGSGSASASDCITTPSPAVLGGDVVTAHFSSTRQPLGLPPIITVRLDDSMGSAVFLFRNNDKRRFAVCISLWGPDTKFGIVAGVEDDDMRDIADEFLFGDWEQTVKRTGKHTLHAAFPDDDNGSGAKVTASVTLGNLEYDPAASAFISEMTVSVHGGGNDFWLETTGPGVWDGWWGRYMDRVTGADGRGRRAGSPDNLLALEGYETIAMGEGSASLLSGVATSGSTLDMVI